MMGYGYAMTGGMFAMMFVGLVFLVAVVVGVVLLVLYLSKGRVGSSSGRPASREPGDILRQRYASGEIDDEEYKRRLAALDGR